MSDPNTNENAEASAPTPTNPPPAPQAEDQPAVAAASSSPTITPGSLPVAGPAPTSATIAPGSAPAAGSAPASMSITPGSAPAAGQASTPKAAEVAETPAASESPAPVSGEGVPAPASEAPAKPKPPIRLTWGRPELLEPEPKGEGGPSGTRPLPGSGAEARRRVARPGNPANVARDREREEEKEVDDALERVMARAASPVPEAPLKKLWDQELEAELEAAMEGFDGGSISVGSPRKPASSTPRTPGSRENRGQEEGKSDVRTGTVIRVSGKNIFIDLGGKSEGLLTVDQLENQPIPEVGSKIEVAIDHFDRNEGILLLRLKGGAVEADWTNLKKGLVVEAKVTKVNKGGLDVEVDGIRGFLPISQIEIGRVEDTSVYLNQKFKVVVTEANPREKNLVVSRRDLLEQERAEMREKTWAELAEGQIREGTVRSIKDFGAFIDLGGVDGLLPIAEMSWFRVKKVEDVLKLGDKVKVQILKIDQVAKRLSLGLRQLTASPWETVEQRFQRGTMVKGKVTRLMEFGAFVELEPGIEGLLHVTALSPNRVRRVSDIVKPDQEVEVRILKVEPDEKRISLSLLPAPKLGPAVEAVEEEEEDDTPPAPKPERKVPLKGGKGSGGGGPLFGSLS